MNQCSEAERYLLEEIRKGSGDAWSQLVERYQGRLVSFARRRGSRGSDAEDLVQDTFLQFLRGVKNFREEASLETYLFLILRRRLAELYRGKQLSACELGERESLAAVDPSASRYARRDEQRDAARKILGEALGRLVKRMHDRLDFRDLQIVELLLYAQQSNQQVAECLGADVANIALLKHRWLKELRESVERQGSKIPWEDSAALDSLLTETWEEQRPSCPKRSTIGGYLLKTLDEAWQQYVEFHVTVLGCSFCRANLEDLRQQNQSDPKPLRERIMQSTVGFFR